MRLPRQRRAGLLLAGVATLGWAAALAFAWFNASLRGEHQADLRQLEAARKTLGAEFDPQRQATGTLPEEAKPAPPRADQASPAASGTPNVSPTAAPRPGDKGQAPSPPAEARAPD